jgi:hypothetical protein
MKWQPRYGEAPGRARLRPSRVLARRSRLRRSFALPGRSLAYPEQLLNPCNFTSSLLPD